MSEELLAFFDVPVPDWSDRTAAIDYIVQFGEVLAGSRAPFDETGVRALVGQVVDRTTNLASSMTNHDIVFNGPERWRERLGGLAVPTPVIHGTEDPLFPFDHGRALANEIPHAQMLGLERVGHAELPRPIWDVVIPAILEHTSTV